MLTAMVPEVVDLAGCCPTRLHYLHIRTRVTTLVDRYLSLSHLNDRHDAFSQTNLFNLLEIPPLVHPAIDLQAFSLQQQVSVNSQIFQTLLTGVGESTTPGLPCFASPIDLPVTEIAVQDLTQGIHQAWSRVSVYVWLMAHSTGDLQAAIAHPLQIHLNQLAALWYWGGTLFGEAFLQSFQASTEELTMLLQMQATPSQPEPLTELDAHQQSIGPSSIETLTYGIELTFAFLRVILRLREWQRQRTHVNPTP
ncbi:MAG: hypothetical protein VKJ24_21035 [Synechococcales bacterium]|nr:hypothetical protein [Synechococcales bacterium]